MKILRLLLVVSLFFGCATQPKKHNTLPKAQSTNVTLVVTSNLTELQKWVILMSKKCAEHLKVAQPPSIQLHYTPSPSYEDGSYILGYFIPKTNEIVIWLRHPQGWDYNLDQVKRTFFHEFLHWFDFSTGDKFWKDQGLEKCPKDHNSIFEKRLKDLGWWEIEKPSKIIS